MRVTVIQGGQWGSESKGMVAEQWARNNRIPNVIRTGSINAGHTVYKGTDKYVFQQLPTASINKDYEYCPNIYIGAGAYIHKPTLDAEVAMVEKVDPNFRKRLFIDYRATMHTDAHMSEARGANRHLSMGATGKGCAEVMVHKIQSRGSSLQAVLASSLESEYNVVDLPEHIDDDCLIEGTQGAELDVHLGPYPYVTSRMTSVAAWVAESGLPCTNVEPVLVFRTFPIRVAGNSGPMPQEISWVELADEINGKLRRAHKNPIVKGESINAFVEAVSKVSKKYGVDGNKMHLLTGSDRVKHRDALSNLHQEAFKSLSPETVDELRKLFEVTTVTKKLRRIARFDMDTFLRVVRREQPVAVVFTFMNYLFPAVDLREANLMKRWIGERMGVHKGVKRYMSYSPFGFREAE